MVLEAVFDPFIQQRPVCVLARGVLEPGLRAGDIRAVRQPFTVVDHDELGGGGGRRPAQIFHVVAANLAQGALIPRPRPHLIGRHRRDAR